MLLLLSQGSLAAGTVYVHDELRLGIRTHPNSSEAPLEVATTGDALDVLEERDGYLRVRAADGTEGWVSKSYTSSEPPARLRLERLQQEHGAVQGERDALAAQLATVAGRAAAQEGKLAALVQENDSLRQQLERYTAAGEGVLQRYRLPLALLLLLGAFCAGVVLGIRWDKRRVASRIGGLEI